jgi:hypothetical protein
MAMTTNMSFKELVIGDAIIAGRMEEERLEEEFHEQFYHMEHDTKKYVLYILEMQWHGCDSMSMV